MQKADLVKVFIRDMLKRAAEKAKLENALGIGPAPHRINDPDKK